MATTIYGEISFRLQLEKATSTQDSVDASEEAIELVNVTFNTENNDYNMTMTYSFQANVPGSSYILLDTNTDKGVYMRTISTDGSSATDEVYPDSTGSPSGLRITNLRDSSFDINTSFQPTSASASIRIVSTDKTSGSSLSGDFITHSDTITQFIRNSDAIGNLDTSGIEDIFTRVSDHDTDFHYISLEPGSGANMNKWTLSLSSSSSSTSHGTKYFVTDPSNYKKTLYIIKEEGFEAFRVYKLTVHSSISDDGYVSFSNQSGPNCVDKDTDITCLVDGAEKDVKVHNLKPGDMVKTYKDGYRKINRIGYMDSFNQSKSERLGGARFVLLKTDQNGLTEDLYVSARHLILVDSLTEEQEKNEKETFGKIYKVNDKFLVQARHHPDFELIEEPRYHRYYQMTLDNDGDIHKRHGIYTNGYLTESTCQYDYETHLTDLKDVVA